MDILIRSSDGSKPSDASAYQVLDRKEWNSIHSK
jgi:hypothetical protein